MPKARHREDRRSSVDAQIVQWLSLSDWLRAIQRFRGYVSAGDFGSALRDGIFEHSSDIHTSEDDTDRAHVCVGLACAVAGAETLLSIGRKWPASWQNGYSRNVLGTMLAGAGHHSQEACTSRRSGNAGWGLRASRSKSIAKAAAMAC